MADFLPQSDSGFADWSTNFTTKITATPTTFGLTAGQATAYTALDTAYQAALLAATTPATRTPVTVAAKDAAKAAAVTQARALAVIVNGFPGITNSQRTSLGLTPRGSGPTPIPPPTTKPVVIVVGYNPLAHVLQIRDESTPVSRAKPAGAISCQVWSKIGPTPPASIADCVFRGIYTKPFLNVGYDSGDAGKQAFYITRWQTRRGDVGPTSDILGATITAA